MAIVVNPCRADVTISDTTISGTLEVPAGEFGNLDGTITLDNGLIDVFGTLSSGRGTVVMTGNGEVHLNAPTGRWSYGCCGTNSVTIDPGVSVLGQRGTSYASKGTVNRGTFAAVDGGPTSGAFVILANHGFVNEGLLEARSGGVLRIDGPTPATFGAGSVLRANADGTIRLQGSAITSLSDLGTVENLGGTIQLYSAMLNNVGQTTTFTGGEWTLLTRTEVVGGMLETSDGGMLSIAAQGLLPRNNPVRFDDVTLLSDLHLLGGGLLEPINGMTLDGANVRFQGGAAFLLLDATSPISGTGSLISEGTSSGQIEASGGLVTLPADVDLRASSGTLLLRRRSGDTTSTFDISGDVIASGGKVINDADVTSHASVTATDGGALYVRDTWNNLGTMQVVDGGVLKLAATLDNQGSLTVDNAIIIYRGGLITGAGSEVITDSQVLASGSSTLGPYLAIDGTRVDRGVYDGSLDLEGGTITIGTQVGQRWTLTDGTLFNGTVNSVDGGELDIVVPPGLSGQPHATLRDLELNANVRIATDASLVVDGPLTGTGQLIVDGGLLSIGNYLDDSFGHSAIDRVTPIGGTVVLTGPIDNVGQTIHLPSGVDWQATLYWRSDGIIGGRVAGDPGVELRVTRGHSAELPDLAMLRQGVTLAVPVVIDDTRMTVRDGLTLDNASITIGTGSGGQYGDARIIFRGEQSLDGVGEIRFNSINGFPSHPEYPRVNMIELADLQDSPAGLTIGPNVVIRTANGSGYVGGRYFYQLPPEPVPLVNHGVLLAENGHALTLFASSFDQQGTLRAEADSELRVEIDAFQNDGRVEAAGGVLKFTGDFTQAADASVHVELSDGLSGTVIDVAGTAALAGELNIQLTDSFVPSPGDTFEVFTYGDHSGEFATFTGDAVFGPGGDFFHPVYQANRLLLYVPIEGDGNLDGVNDGLDYLAWAVNYGQTGVGFSGGDYSGDGINDGFDYLVLIAHFGESVGGLATAVPEPGTFVLLLIGVVACGVRRRLR